MKETVQQLTMFDPDSWSGKTCPAHLAAEVEKTSAVSLKKRQGSKTKMPLFLDLRGGSGVTQDAFWETDGALPGGYSMHSFGESPQRRRRIALVADFGGHAAPEILFERSGLSGDPETGGTPWEGTAGDAENGVGKTICIQGNCIDRADTAGCNGKGWRDDDVSYTLNTIDRPAVYAIENHPADSRVKIEKDGVVQTLTSRMGTGGGNVPMCIGNGQADNTRITEKADTLNCMHDQQAVMYNQTVRRLTPLECERLQGYPDGWTYIGRWVDSKGKKHISSDSARYKALGNSIALPPWRYVLGRLYPYCGECTTMASLFDGIGGFPLIWSELGGDTLWASEIEEFPIAVTMRRFVG